MKHSLSILTIVFLFFGCSKGDDSSKNLTVNFEEQVSDTDGDGIEDSVDQDNSTRSGVPVDDNGVMLNPIYLDDNGVTIISEEWGIAGDTGIINGEEYLIVDDNTLRSILASDALGRVIDMPNLCTSLVTNIASSR